MVAAASAVTILSSVSGPSGQDRAGGVADQRDFEGALRAALARGEVLNWTGGNVRLKRPIAIDITELDMNGARVIVDFNDATKTGHHHPRPRVAEERGPPQHEVPARDIVAESPALDAIGLICLTNQRWMYSWKFIDLDIEHFARDGLFFDGSVFEGECHAVTCADNGRNGMTFRNDGPQGDVGIVSAISIFGGQMRKNGNAGIKTWSAIAYQEPRDLNISQTYFVENKGPGLNAVAGLSMAMALRLREQRKIGINLMNEGRLLACRASTHGTQPYLVNASLNRGSILLDACRASRATGHSKGR